MQSTDSEKLIKALNLYDQGDYIQSKAIYEKLAERHSNIPFIWLQLGLIAFHTGDTKGSIPYFDRAISLNHDFAIAWRAKGSACLQLGFLAEAKDILLQSLSLQPHRNAYISLSVCLRRQHDFREAILCCNKALLQSLNNESRGECYYQRGLCKIGLSKYKSGLADFRKAVNLCEENFPAMKELGELYIILKRPKSAVKWLTLYLNNNKHDDMAFISLAFAHWRSGDIINANNKFVTAIKLNRGNEDYYKWYSEFLDYIGNSSEAKRISKMGMRVSRRRQKRGHSSGGEQGNP